MANEKIISLEGHPLVDAESIHELDTETSVNGKVTVVKDGDSTEEVDIYTASKIDDTFLPLTGGTLTGPLTINSSTTFPLIIKPIPTAQSRRILFYDNTNTAIGYIGATNSSANLRYLQFAVYDKTGVAKGGVNLYYNEMTERLEFKTDTPLEPFANDNRIATTEWARSLNESARRLVAKIMTTGGQIKLIGDSITSGQGGTGFDNTASGGGAKLYSSSNRYVNVNGHCWANSLRDYMSTYGYSNVRVKNYGISGIRSHILKMLVDPEGTHYSRPSTDVPLIDNDKANNNSDDLVICMVGTNDRGEVPANPGENYGGELRDNILYMYNYLKGIGKDVIFMSNIPAGAQNEALSPHCSMDKINRIIVTTCAWNNIPYISMYQLFKDWLNRTGNNIEDYLADHLHPNDAGYDVMFELLADALGFTVPYSATSKLIPNYINQTTADGRYLKLTGGSVTGNVYVKNNDLERNTTPYQNISNDIGFTDKNNNVVGRIRNNCPSDAYQAILLTSSNGSVEASIEVGIRNHTTVYTKAPTPAANSNTDAIATTEWVIAKGYATSTQVNNAISDTVPTMITNGLATYVKCYTTVTQLQLSNGCSVIDILDAMPNNTMAMIPANGASSITGLPSNYGVLSIKKINDGRTDIEFKEAASAGNGMKYFGSLNVNTRVINWYKYTVTAV